MQKKAQGFSYQVQQPVSQNEEWTTDLDCYNCTHNGPFIIVKKRETNKLIEAMCPSCKKIINVQAVIDPQTGDFKMENNKVKVNDGPSDAPIFQTKKAQAIIAQKRDSDGVPTKDSYNGPRIFNSHEDVNPQGIKTIGPFTKEREDYKEKTKVLQPIAFKTDKVKQATSFKKENELTSKELEILSNSNKIISEGAKKELAKTAAMYEQVSVMPASSNGLCQWCPKLRTSVSMDICATKCIDARRIPQTKENEFETYQDYLIKGGSEKGEIYCGYKDWLKREVDAFYPGWVEDHIKKIGGEVSGSETNFGNRRMNLDEGTRRHLPRYPEEKATEKLLEKRHKYVPQKKTAQCIMDEFPEDEFPEEKTKCKCKKGTSDCTCKK